MRPLCKDGASRQVSVRFISGCVVYGCTNAMLAGTCLGLSLQFTAELLSVS